MTTLEFAKKNLEKARGNLERAKTKTGTTEEEISALHEKITHWESIINMIEWWRSRLYSRRLWL